MGDVSKELRKHEHVINAGINEFKKHEDVIKKGLDSIGKGVTDQMISGFGNLFNIMQK